MPEKDNPCDDIPGPAGDYCTDGGPLLTATGHPSQEWEA